MTARFWQQEVQRLAQGLTDRLLNGRGQDVCMSDLLHKNAPEIFEVLLNTRGRKLYDQEEPLQIAPTERFDLKKDIVERSLNYLSRLIIQTARFSPDEVVDIANRAIQLELDFIVRPRQTLLALLFKRESSRKVDDIEVVLEGLSGKRPFIDLARRELSSLQEDTVSSERLLEILTEVERRVYKRNPISAFLNDVEAFFQLEKKTAGESDETLKSKIFLTMLKERNLHGIYTELSESGDDKQSWTVDEIENALNRHLIVGNVEMLVGDRPESKAGGSSTQSSTHGDDQFSEINIDEIDSVSDVESDTEAPTVGKIEFMEELETTEEKTEEKTQEARKARPVGGQQSEQDDESFLVSHEDLERQPGGFVPDLATQIQHDDRETIIKHIFRKDEEKFDEFIETLEPIQSWKEAKKVIDDELIERNIDQYSTEAVLLGDIVFARYFSKA